MSLLFLKYNHTFEFFKEHVSMFQTSSSAIASVTLKLKSVLVFLKILETLIIKK